MRERVLDEGDRVKRCHGNVPVGTEVHLVVAVVGVGKRLCPQWFDSLDRPRAVRIGHHVDGVKMDDRRGLKHRGADDKDRPLVEGVAKLHARKRVEVVRFDPAVHDSMRHFTHVFAQRFGDLTGRGEQAHKGPLLIHCGCSLIDKETEMPVQCVSWPHLEVTLIIPVVGRPRLVGKEEGCGKVRAGFPSWFFGV